MDQDVYILSFLELELKKKPISMENRKQKNFIVGVLFC